MTNTRYIRVMTALVAVLVVAAATPARAHHSFAMYNMSETKVMTGKLTRFIPGSNHAQLIFEVLSSDGKPVMEKASRSCGAWKPDRRRRWRATASRWKRFRPERS